MKASSALLAAVLLIAPLAHASGSAQQVEAGNSVSLELGGELDQDESGLIVPKERRPFKNLVLRVKERVYDPAEGENTKWKHVPTKTISFPLAKIQYETVQFVTSLVTETVRRSPVHNALGTVDEAKKTLRLFKNGLFDMFRGILNPKNGAFSDGLFNILGGAWNSLRVVTGAVKTGASLIAYPVYRIAGGEKSRRDAIKGKRAAIISIDSGYYPLNLFLDPYGDQIVRNHLSGVVDYYCVVSSTEGSTRDCIEKIPYDIEYVDFVALTHSGGSYQNRYSAGIALKHGFKPGLMLSIGCYDDDSDLTKASDTMGQRGVSWAVHFYLSGAIAKRLRGIPMDQAAKEAFAENLPLNFINPVSLLGQAGVGLMGDTIMGSYPDVRENDSEAQKARLRSIFENANTIRILKYAKLYNEGQISPNEFGKLLELYEADKNFMLAGLESNSETYKDLLGRADYGHLVENFKKTRFPRKVHYWVKRGGKIKVRKSKYVL